MPEAAPLRRNRDFVALWIGQAVSWLGISISSFAYPLVVLHETGSPAKAGLVGSVLAATTFLLRLPAGLLVDRWNRKAVMVLCDVGRAAVSGSFALMLAFGHFVLAMVLVVAFVEGALGVLFGPAEAAAVRHVVAPDQIREAVARNQTRSHAAGLIGPPLGGALLGASRALPFLVDALSYLVSLVSVLVVRSPLQEPTAPRAERPAMRDVLEGVRWLWARPSLRALLVWLTLQGFAFSSLGLVILVLARDRGASSGELGLMFAMASAGGVLGALASPRILRMLSPRALLTTFAWTMTSATLLLYPAHSPYVIGLLGSCAFFLAPAVNAFLFSLIAEHAPDRLLGRANSGAIQLSNLLTPVGPIGAGSLLGLLGPSRTIFVYAALAAALSVAASLLGAFAVPRERFAESV